MAKGPTTATEMFKHLTKQPAPVGKPNTAQSLEKVFKAIAPKHNEMACIPSFTLKDKGQLGRLAKLWGTNADKIMDAICRDWIAFAKSVSAATGNNNRPLQPHLPWIVKYESFAKAFALKQPVQLTAPVEESKAETPVVEPNQAVTPAKKKLVIIKKGPNPDHKIPLTGEPSVTEAYKAPKPKVEEDEDQLMSMEALLAYGEKFKT